jgi:bacterioferritin-associated ferredoxin
MIVCVCKNINETKMRELLAEAPLETVINETGVCTNCCSCKQKIQEIVLENAVEKYNNER